MGRFKLSPQARRDLVEIRCNIARDSPRHAARVIEKIRHKIRELADYPGHGHSRPDLTSRDLRFWRIYSYLIVYRPATSPLEVVAVPSASEDVAALLDEGDAD